MNPLARMVWLWRNRPRVVSRDAYARLVNQLPAEQRKGEGQRVALERLCAAHRRERLHHREAIAEKEELKTLLAQKAPDTFRLWLEQRRNTAPNIAPNGAEEAK